MKETVARSYKRYKEKGYEFWYWAIDVHDVIFKGDYKTNCGMVWLPNAKRAFKIIANIPEIKVILWTSSHEEQIKKIIDKIKDETGLEVYAVNSNPDFSKDELCDFNDKFCFDLLLDDKAGFNYNDGWEEIIESLLDIGLGFPKIVADDIAPENKWVQLRQKTYNFGNRVGKYIYSTETGSNAKKIIVLPYRTNPKLGIREYMFVREHNVLFGYTYTVITGGVEEKTDDLKKIRAQANLELMEEAGIIGGVEFIKIMTSVKSIDTKYYLFTIELNNPLSGSVDGDGSIDELFTVKKWLTYEEAIEKVNDAIALASLMMVERK